MNDAIVTTAAEAPPGDSVVDLSATTAMRSVADTTVTVIEPRSGWRMVDMAELWRHRELLYFLMWRDIKVRYKQTVLGAAWAILQPLAQMLVFTIFFGRLARMPAGGVEYPIFSFAGLLPWIFISSAMQSAANSVVANQNLVTKIYFPRLYMPFSAIGTSALDFLVSSVMLILLMVYYAVVPTWQILLLPLVVAVTLITVIGAGTLLSALIVAFRDFKYVVPFMIQLWMFATPSIYMDAAQVVSPRWLPVMRLNPAYGLIACFRSTVLGLPIDWAGLATSTVIAGLLLVAGCLYFRRVERVFADII